MAKDAAGNRKAIANWISGPRNRPERELILISHLGNIDGRNEETENTVSAITSALNLGYNVCCYVVSVHAAFLLPSARGYQRLPYALLSNPKVWYLSADASTLDALCASNAHAVPDGAAVALTSVHYLWCQPGSNLTPRSIAVFPEQAEPSWLASSEPAGLCSDAISRYL